MLKFALLRKPRIVVTNVRYHLGDHPQVMGATRRPPGVDRSTPPAPAPGRGVEHWGMSTRPARRPPRATVAHSLRGRLRVKIDAPPGQGKLNRLAAELK